MRARTLPILAVLALAGCGEGPTTRVRAHAFNVTLDDYLIRPQNISAPGGGLRLTVVNHGRLGHTLRIRVNDKVVLAFMGIPTAQQRTRGVGLRKGTYRMFCAIGNHEELGMRGTLTVR